MLCKTSSFFPSSVNDLKATGPKSFYYTNSFWNNKPTFTILEIFSGVKLGNLGHYDGQKAEKLVSGLGGANGIQLSPDGKSVAVTEALIFTWVARSEVSVPW